MKKVVLDTNVIVSAIFSPNGKCSKILDMVFTDKIQICYSIDILSEYKDVLSRPSLALNPGKKNLLFMILGESGIPVSPVASTIALPDESDRVFYDTAKESGAVLITGNTKHFPMEDFIVTPSCFLELFLR